MPIAPSATRAGSAAICRKVGLAIHASIKAGLACGGRRLATLRTDPASAALFNAKVEMP